MSSTERSKVDDTGTKRRAPQTSIAASAEINEPHVSARRARTLYALAALLSLVGLADAIYLTIHHLTGRGLQCGGSASCDEVLASSYATAGGFPLAAFGAIAYFVAFSLATLVIFGYERARSVLMLLVALMFLVTLWLFFVQAFVLRAFCYYCLLSAAVVLLLTVCVIAARPRYIVARQTVAD